MVTKMTQEEIERTNREVEWELMKGRAMSALLREIIIDAREQKEKEHVWTAQDKAGLIDLLNTDERRATPTKLSMWQKVKQFFGRLDD